MTLTLLMITKLGSPHLHALADVAREVGAEFVALFDGLDVHSNGSLESVLDEAVAQCTGDYILRIDDDEACSPALVEWLKTEKYLKRPAWCFPRVNLYGNRQTMIVNPPLWPDLQTRLTTKALAGGRTHIHARAIDPGVLAPAPLLHFKFLEKSIDERRAIAARYERLQPGAGTGHYLPFSVPEDVYDRLELRPVSDLT